MAMDLQKVDLRGLVAKIQAVAGTPETLNVADDGVLAIETNPSFKVDELERSIDRPGHGARPYVNVKRRCEYEFGLELRGAATPGDAAPIGTILRACGFAQTLDPGVSAIYNLVTGNFEMITINGYAAGEVVHGMDARGAVTQIEMSVRNFAKAQAMVLALPPTGVDVIEDITLPAIDYSDFQAPVPIETESFEVDIGGTKLNTISVTVDTGAQVEIYEGSESRFVFLREFYRPSGTIRVFKEQRSTFNPEDIALAHGVQDVYATIAGGGEIVRLDLRGVQLTVPTRSDQDGIAAWDIPFKATGSTTTNCMSLSFLDNP